MEDVSCHICVAQPWNPTDPQVGHAPEHPAPVETLFIMCPASLQFFSPGFFSLCRWHLCNSEKDALTRLVSSEVLWRSSRDLVKNRRRTLRLSHHCCEQKRADHSFGSHILFFYPEIDENSAPGFWTRPFASVTLALCSFLLSVLLATSLPFASITQHLDCQPGALRMFLFPGPRGCKLQAYTGQVDGVS